ncbi:MAG: excinuclease ABC subunit UvrC [Clostridia bacterium]|nr:excinuclease ABC subunit UvrC [Clostridia bacterium]
MSTSDARTEYLLKKANSLPTTPGVYLMKDKNGKVIYVGKSRKLKQRVSQYFQNSKKNYKTDKLVSLVADFDYFLCSTEIEALSLENTLIKQYTPKYNIRLKDDKSYPYIKITSELYPRLVYTRKRLADKGKYFGPFTGTSTVFNLLDLMRKSLGIPTCKRRFPEDIGKERPCLYYQIGQCCGVCTGKVTPEEYAKLIACATDILRGNIGDAIKVLERQMTEFAESESYEAAARCRDTIRSLTALKQKQYMVASPDAEQDIFGIYTDDFCSCISVMYVRGGAVTDKADHIFGSSTIVNAETLSSFLIEHYNIRDYIPKNILVSFELPEEDKNTLESYFSGLAGYKVSIRTPERGALHNLCNTVEENAKERARQYEADMKKSENTLVALAEALRLEVLPERIEAYDISNIGADNKVCGMIVSEGGKFKRADYRSFNIKTVSGTDDYASLREALTRRFEHLLADKVGAFAIEPDLILLDGGKTHVAVAKELLDKYGLSIPVFGMVKDDFHKTRALCSDTEEINIAKQRSLYMFIFGIQEEVHRFSAEKTMKGKRSTLKKSSLEKITGIGPAKAAALLRAFGGLAEIKTAEIDALERVRGISHSDAVNIRDYFKNKGLKNSK